MIQPINCLLLLRALNTEKENREVLTVEQFQAAVKNNPVEMFNMLNKKLEMNKKTITQLNAQLNVEIAALKLTNEQVKNLLKEQADLNAHIVKLLMQNNQEEQK